MPRYSNERKEAVLKKLLPSSGWANHTLAGLKKLHDNQTRRLRARIIRRPIKNWFAGGFKRL
jgi:hypothetical protein